MLLVDNQILVIQNNKISFKYQVKHKEIQCNHLNKCEILTFL